MHSSLANRQGEEVQARHQWPWSQSWNHQTRKGCFWQKPQLRRVEEAEERAALHAGEAWWMSSSLCQWHVWNYLESQVAKTVLQMAFRCLEIPFVQPQKLGSLLFLGVQFYNYRQFHVCLDLFQVFKDITRVWSSFLIPFPGINNDQNHELKQWLNIYDHFTQHFSCSRMKCLGSINPELVAHEMDLSVKVKGELRAAEALNLSHVARVQELEALGMAK